MPELKGEEIQKTSQFWAKVLIVVQVISAIATVVGCAVALIMLGMAIG